MKELPEDIQQKIIAYIDGDLPADEAAALEVYLVNTDPGMSEMVIGMMADRQSISVLPKVSAPKDLAGNIMEQLERSSLLHGVEQDLNRARKPWWQTRVAVAAAVTLFIGGFSAIIISTIHRSQNPVELAGNPTNNPIATISKPGPVIGKGGGPENSKDGGQVAIAPEINNGKLGFNRSGNEADLESPDRLNKALANNTNNTNLKLKGGAPAWLVVDTRETIEDKLTKMQRTVDHGAANDYLPIPTPQEALSCVSAAPNDALAGPPVVVYIQARDEADAKRLEDRLTKFMHEADFAPAGESHGDEAKVARVDGKSLDGFDNISAATAPNQLQMNGTVANNGNFKLIPPASNVTGNGTVALNGNGNPTNTISVDTTNPANFFNQNKGDYNNNGSVANNPTTPGNNDNIIVLNNTEGINNKLSQVQASNTGVYNNVNAGVAITNSAQTKNLHAGAPRGGNANFDNNAGQYAANGYREYGRTAEQQLNARTQQDAKVYESQKARDSMQDSKFLGEAGQPFRVYLSPEQLDQVTSEFRVRSINRGQVTYVIPDSPAQAQVPQAQLANNPRKDAEPTLRVKDPVAPAAPKSVAEMPIKPTAVPGTVAAATRPAEVPAPATPSAPIAQANPNPRPVDEQNSPRQEQGSGQQTGADQSGGEQQKGSIAKGGGQQTGAGQQPGGQQSGGFGQQARAGAAAGATGGGGGGRGGGKAPGKSEGEAGAKAEESINAGKESAEQRQAIEKKQLAEKAKTEMLTDDAARRNQSQRLEVIISIQTPGDKAAKPNAAESERSLQK